MRRARMLGLMMLCLTTTGCPVPTDFSKEPKQPNLPPVVDPILTTSYSRSEVVTINSRPTWSLWVDEPNVGDTLAVRVVKDLHLALESTNPAVILLENSVFPSDVPPPEVEAAASLRTKQLELAFTPCPSDDPTGPGHVLTVCISDRGFVNVTDAQKNPCLPSGGGYMANYSVVVQCIAAPP